MSTRSIRRAVRRWSRRVRETRMFARALASAHHPILAQIVPVRRCNLACAYCNEYDATSAPVPTPLVLRRIDRLAELGTGIVDVSGGEPLLHPDLDAIVAHIRRRRMIAGLLTNGYLLTERRIDRLNRAGLDRLQISIDNVAPNDVSRKSLKVLDRRLELLAEHAEFDVNINAVVGAGVARPEEALAVGRRALALGFSASVGLVHAGGGQAAPLPDQHRKVLDEFATLARGFYTSVHDRVFQRNLADGRPNEWQCGAGARYLYVCEDGLVHWCSQQRGYPATSIELYTAADIERERRTRKSCAPYCTVSCVHRVALVDAIRERPHETIEALVAAYEESGGRTPPTVRLIVWAFLTGAPRRPLRRLAAWALGGH